MSRAARCGHAAGLSAEPRFVLGCFPCIVQAGAMEQQEQTQWHTGVAAISAWWQHLESSSADPPAVKQEGRAGNRERRGC